MRWSPVAAVAAAATIPFVAAAPALGHASFVSASPAPGATVAHVSPDQFVTDRVVAVGRAVSIREPHRWIGPTM